MTEDKQAVQAPDTGDVIANAERLVAQANAVLAEAERFFAASGYDRATVMRELEARQGKGAVERVKTEVAQKMQETLNQAREQAARARAEATPAGAIQSPLRRRQHRVLI